MSKSFIVALLGLLLFTAPTLAQSLKFGHFDSGAFLNDLPDMKKVNETLNAEMSKMENTLAMLNEDFQKRVKDYQQKAQTMTDAQRSSTEQELGELQQRIQTYRQTSMDDLRRKQQELVQPVIMKVRKAVEEVGANGGFIYILEASGVVCGTKSEDVTPLVRKRLGL